LDTSNSNSNSNETNDTSGETQISSEFENSINCINSNPQKTLVIHHNSSFKHGEIKENNLLLRVKRRQTQVENPDRLGVLLKPNTGILNSDFFKKRFEFIECSAPATLVDILRVHDFDYIDSVRKTCEELKTSGKSNTYKYDVDTYINQHTYESATYASGCVIQAVDSIMKGNHKNAICLVRPPGHHAGFYGKVE
jgi:acetoin utilization deacetylase AcuC-like enzyme